ncbi:MAG: hypothetical protein H3C32_02420 [Anaerolineae bacterium]|nr:hypothetical protein [Anaerolineae bacterium]
MSRQIRWLMLFVLALTAWAGVRPSPVTAQDAPTSAQAADVALTTISLERVDLSGPTTADNNLLLGVNLSGAGGGSLTGVTDSRIGEPTGIVVLEQMVSAPAIHDWLSKRFVIEGSFSEDDARELAARLINSSPVPHVAFPDPRAPQLLPVDFSLIVDSIGAILLLVVILLL